MSVYSCDGTFNGFLCLLHESSRRGEVPDSILCGEDAQPLFFPPVEAPRDEDLAFRVRNALLARIPGRALTTAWYTLLSSLPDRGMTAYRYLSLAWSRGRDGGEDLANPVIWRAFEARRAVSRERHRFLGLLRFSAVGGILYAPFEPEADLLPLLGGHFASRLGGERWIIHDTRRNRAAVYSRPSWRIADFRLPRGLSLPEEEKSFRELWKRYFSSIAVESRLNPGLQRHFMPKKYWGRLVEKEPPGGGTGPRQEP